MVDIEDKNKKTSETSASAGAPVAAQPEPTLDHMSKGEKWYNRMVYKGINYWLNLSISLVVTDFFMHGRGKAFFSEGVKHISDGAVASKFMKRKAANRFGEIALGAFTLNSGGNILLIPTKILEDHKRSVVHWLNKSIFHENQTAPDGHEQTPDEIYIEQEQPKQSWGRMIWRRVIGLIATTGTGWAIDVSLAQKLDKPIGLNGDAITHKPGQQVYADTVIKGIGDYIPGGKSFISKPAAQRYISYASLDWIYTLITSTILQRTNGAKHLKGRGKKEAEIFRKTDEDIPLPDTMALNALHRASDTEKNSAADVVSSSSESKLEGYKKKSILPAGKYTDVAKTGETDYSMAP